MESLEKELCLVELGDWEKILKAHPHFLFIFLLPDSPKYEKATRQAYHL